MTLASFCPILAGHLNTLCSQLYYSDATFLVISTQLRLASLVILLISRGVCAGIKAIKLYAWEQPYIDRINQLREAELKMIRKAAFYQIFNTMMFGGGPILVSLASFGTYTLLGYPLTASVAFPALALFNLLRFPVMMFPNQIMNLIAAKVALDRIQNYMQVTIPLLLLCNALQCWLCVVRTQTVIFMCMFGLRMTHIFAGLPIPQGLCIVSTPAAVLLCLSFLTNSLQ